MYIEPVRVLLIEDDPSTRWLVRTTLKNRCTLATASGVENGIKRILDHQPELIFLDINLPDGNGFMLLDWLRDNMPHVNVVIFSGQCTDDNINRAIDSGAKGFIAKPFCKDDILDYVSFS